MTTEEILTALTALDNGVDLFPTTTTTDDCDHDGCGCDFCSRCGENVPTDTGTWIFAQLPDGDIDGDLLCQECTRKERAEMARMYEKHDNDGFEGDDYIPF
jgi:hypothetical protein